MKKSHVVDRRVVCMECWEFFMSYDVVKIGNSADICKKCLPKYERDQTRRKERIKRMKKDVENNDATWMTGS
jgi:hypothetical protein